MAKITLHPMMQSAQGKMGNAVFRRTHTGEMTLIKLADMSRVKWSKAQQEHRQRFKEAAAYAKSAMADPQVRAKYQIRTAAQHKSPYDLAVSDYFKGRDLLSGA